MRSIKLILIFFAVFSIRIGYCQNSYIRAVDSIVKKIENLEYFYTAEENKRYFSADSTQVGFRSVVYTYADKSGNKLKKVDLMTNTPNDNSSIIYYFNDKKLIKVDVRVIVHGKLYVQQAYFKNNKAVFSSTYYDIKFARSIYLQKASMYLKYRSKIYNPNFIN